MAKSRSLASRRPESRSRAEPRRRMNPRLVYDLVAIALGATGVLLAMALWQPGLAGAAGRALALLARLLVGSLVVALPPALFLAALGLVLDYRRATSRHALAGAAGLLVTLLGVLHLSRWNPGGGFETFGPRLTALLGREADPVLVYAADGGFLGALIGLPLQVFGYWGAWVVLAAVGLASLLVIVDLTMNEIGRRVRERSRSTAENLRARKEARQPARGRSALVVEVEEKPARRRSGPPVATAEPAGRRGNPLKQLLERAAGRSGPPALPEPEPEPEPAPRSPRRTPRRMRADAAPVPSLLTPPSSGEYVLPPVDLLDPSPPRPKRPPAETEANIAILEDTLGQFRIQAQVVEIADGPTVTRYEIRLGEGIRVKKILDLADNIAMSLAAMSVRVEAPIPGKSAIGIEVPKKQPALVTLRECLEADEAGAQRSPLAFALGKDVAGRARWADLTTMPHLLVAGATNAGKSVCLNALIASFLYRTRPEEVKLLLIDPKRVELSLFEGIPHLCHPVVKDVRQAAGILRWALKEMDRRYDLFARVMTRNIQGYNEKVEDPAERLPYLVIVVDELADLMMQQGAEVEQAICRLAQLARATGIHLVIATQRPSVDVITGLIKANIPSRIAFSVTSQIDSRTVLDAKGAESLIGRGDMLFKPVDAAKPIRIQGAFVTENEVGRLVAHLRQQGKPDYTAQPLTVDSAATGDGFSDEPEDELLEPAARFLVTTGHASTSMLQRKFKIGYTRAARLVDMLEARGVVGPLDGARPRELLMSLSGVEEMFRSARDELFGRQRVEQVEDDCPAEFFDPVGEEGDEPPFADPERE